MNFLIFTKNVFPDPKPEDSNLAAEYNIFKLIEA
jgi:hypothetical protein